MQEDGSVPLVRFSEFLGIGYYGDEKQHVVAPIFDFRRNAEHAWAKVMDGHLIQGAPAPVFHVVFVEHPAKYEFIAYPVEMNPDQINYVLYRSFSSLGSLHKFKQTYGGRTYIKFGWHDLTKSQKFDVLAAYAFVDSVDFLKIDDVKAGSLVEQIQKS